MLSRLKKIAADVMLEDALQLTWEQHCHFVVITGMASGVLSHYMCWASFPVYAQSLFIFTAPYKHIVFDVIQLICTLFSLQLRILHTVSLLTCETSSSGELPSSHLFIV